MFEFIYSKKRVAGMYRAIRKGYTKELQNHSSVMDGALR